MHSSPTRDSSIYKKLKEGKYSFEQTRQMLLARKPEWKSKSKNQKKYSPRRKSLRDFGQLSRMIHSNSRYLTVPHGVPDHLKRNSNPAAFDRNKVYA